MISAVFIVNLRGDVLVLRHYRDDVGRGVADAFRSQVIAAREIRSPIKLIGSASFMHVKVGELYFVAVSKQNVNAGMVFEFVNKFVTILKFYMGQRLTENGVRNNFVLIYELLDETLDFGYPQNMELDSLKQYITQEGLQSHMDVEAKSKATIQATGAIGWRREGIKYRKNVIWIDVIESVNLLLSQKGTILRSDVSGQVVIKSFLSGMPECKFGLNDKVMMERERSAGRKAGQGVVLDDCTFHQCVRLNKFDSDKTIAFIPPDGTFEIMRYRTTENVNLPFKVLAAVKEYGRTRVEVKVSVRSTFSPRLTALNVIVKVPCPENTAMVKMHTTGGRAKYESDRNAIVWRLRQFPGKTEATISTELDLQATTSNPKPWSRPPVQMEFQVAMFTASGLHVRFLRVYEKSNYQTIKWVRYITKGGQYQVRI